jgi:hypothetical protein
MSKYDPLGHFLRERSSEETPMTFAEIEKVIGISLPPAAERHPAWWSNNPSNNVMTKVWLDAGYRSERVDLGGRKLVFRRSQVRPNSPRPAGGQPPRAVPMGILETIRHRLRGSVTMAPDFNPAAPTGEHWDAES